MRREPECSGSRVSTGSSGGHSREKTPRFKPRQEVELLCAKKDKAGRVLAEAGARGWILEELDTAPGWWLVQYQSTMQCWPTLGQDLRRAAPRAPGGMNMDALLGALRALLRGIIAGEAEAAGNYAQTEQRELREILAYVMGEIASVPDRIAGPPQRCKLRCCVCLDDGVCTKCDGAGGPCRACRGTRVCAACLPMELSAEERARLLVETSSSASRDSPPGPVRSRRLRKAA